MDFKALQQSSRPILLIIDTTDQSHSILKCYLFHSQQTGTPLWKAQNPSLGYEKLHR